MSVKSGSKFLAGNLAFKVQDRLFYAKRTFQNNQEYYDIEVPVGASLGFTQASKIALIISGTNTTTTPILRYKTNMFQIVGGSFNGVAPIKLGELRDGGLAEMYMGTSSQYIYLASNENSYDVIRNTPIFQDRDGNLIPLTGGISNYDTLHLPYLLDNKLILNSKDFLEITTNGFDYGPKDFSKQHSFLSGERLVWKKSINESYELATLRDIEELAIGDKFVAVLAYSRDTQIGMEAIDDANSGDKCLVIANNTIYQYDGSSWNVLQVLQYTDADNGKYYDIEDVDGIHDGKAIWNIADGGHFQVFINYTNGIDHYSITRNSDRALQVARLLNSFTIKVNIPGMEPKEISFDGSENKILEINTTLSDYYTKKQIDGYYNDNTSGNLAAFYTNGSNTQIHSLDISKANLVLKTTGNFLKVNNTDVDASLIKYSKSGVVGSVKDFLDKNFAFTDIVNNFIAGQKIGNELIATQNWVENWADGTLLPNKFNLALMTNLTLALDAPTATKTSLRFNTINLNTGEEVTTDVELPVVSDTNNGLVTTTQRNLWNTVTSKTSQENSGGGITSVINYQDNTPRVTSATSTQKAGMEVTLTDNILKISLLATDIASGNNSGIFADKDGVYSYQNENLVKDNNHLVVNRGYLNDNAVMQNAIQANAGWSTDRVVLNYVSIGNITASGATLDQKGSSVLNKNVTSASTPFPIVNSTKAGLATSAMFNQIEANRSAIEAINGQGSVAAYLGQNPTQAEITAVWNASKPGITALEGANVINLTVGNTWRYLTVNTQLEWVDLGVLGGNAIATVQNTGLVKSTENTLGMIQVESDGTMSLIGWDGITSNIENLDLSLGNLEESFNNHIADITTVNTTPHVSPTDRNKWNNASTTANNAIPKLTSAVNNNITLWSSGGVVKDSGKAFVTNFTTPTDNGIPTALAVNNLVTNAISTEATTRANADSALQTKIDTLETNVNSLSNNKMDKVGSAIRPTYNGSDLAFYKDIPNKKVTTETGGRIWKTKTWNGSIDPYGNSTWTDGENIYYSKLNSQYVLDKATSTWNAKTWNGSTSFNGANIWTDGENIYYSSANTHLVLDKATSTWNAKTWNGLAKFNGNQVWTDGENIYHSKGSLQYVLDKATSTWNTKTWNGLPEFYGFDTWADGENIYYSSGSKQYVLKNYILSVKPVLNK